MVSTFAQHGPYSVIVSVSDTAENTGTASFVWTVDNVAPVVIAHSYGVTKNTPLIVDATLGVLSGSSDPGGETIQAVRRRHHRAWHARSQQRRFVHLHAEQRLLRPRQLHVPRVRRPRQRQRGDRDA